MAKKMNKGEDNKLLNMQTCVLKVNIHCDGCRKKVKKLLNKIEGVYTIEIVADQGKVTVVGCVDSATLVRKLNKAGKYAVEWPTKGENQKSLTNQLQKLQLDHPKEYQHKDNGKPQKNGNGGGGGGGGGGKDKDHKGDQLKQLEGFQDKGLKDMFPNLKDIKFPFKKEQKSVKFVLPSEDDDLDGDFGDELLDEFDDDEDDEFGELDGSDADDYDDILDDPKIMKGMKDDALNDKKGGSDGGGGNGKKGDQVQVANNGKGTVGKNGVAGIAQDNKNGGNNTKGGSVEVPQSNKGQGFHGMNLNQMGNMTQMGQFPAAQGLPAGAAGIPAGYYNGGMAPQEMMPAGAAAGNLNPYQQQYMQAMLQQQQQRMMMNGQGAYPMPMSMGYGYGYGRPAYPNVQYNHSMFSDENPNGCSIM